MIITANLTNQYQTFFSKELLTRVQHEVQLAAFAQKQDLPKNAGATTIRFYRPPVGDLSVAGAPTTLTEGVQPGTDRDYTKTYVDVPLVLIGEVTSITDVVTHTGLLNELKIATQVLADDFTLHVDEKLRNPLCHASTGLTKQYAQSLANYAALTGASDAAGKLVPKDLLIAATKLYKNRAMRFGSPTTGRYAAVFSAPQVADLMDSAEFREVVRYGNADKIFKGEVGEYYGIKITQTSVPFTELGTEGTFSATDTIHVGLVLGKEAFGCANLATMGSSMNKPEMIIVDKPDMSNRLGQKISVGWKAYWGQAVLNPAWGVALRSRTTFR